MSEKPLSSSYKCKYYYFFKARPLKFYVSNIIAEIIKYLAFSACNK